MEGLFQGRQAEQSGCAGLMGARSFMDYFQEPHKWPSTCLLGVEPPPTQPGPPCSLPLPGAARGRCGASPSQCDQGAEGARVERMALEVGSNLWPLEGKGRWCGRPGQFPVPSPWAKMRPWAPTKRDSICTQCLISRAQIQGPSHPPVQLISDHVHATGSPWQQVQVRGYFHLLKFFIP